MIDPATIQRIYDAIDIVDVVKDYVSLKKRGANYLGLCPFHNEKTPSFTVSASKGIFKCFGCGKGGNAVNFIMEHEHLSYAEALRLLAKKYHIEIVEKAPSEEDIRQQNERESLLVISDFAARFFAETLRKDAEGKAVGLAYFKERGIRDDMIERFQLGYSPEKRDAFTRRALQEGYQLEYLIKSGLTIQHEGGEPFDRFHGRVMFPIHSLSGKVIGFGGRILRSDKNIAKYLNSPESEIYHKSQVLYGLYQARKAIEKTGKVFLVEGYTDVIALHQCGIENVVASSGTSLTVEQIRLIKRFTNNITILYDGDEAGIKASLRGIDMVLEEGMNLKVLLLPEGEDPDSYSRKVSITDFQGFIERNESDFITFKTRLLMKDAQNDPIKRANLINDVVRSIASIPDPVTRSVYIRECSVMLSTDEQTLYSQVNRIRREKSVQKSYREYGIPEPPAEFPSSLPEVTVFDEVKPKEREIIRLILNYPEKKVLYLKEHEDDEPKEVTISEFFVREMNRDEMRFSDPIYQKIFSIVEEYVDRGEPLDEAVFLRSSDPELSRVAASLLAPMPELSAIWAKEGSIPPTEEDKLPELVPKTLLALKNQIVLDAIKEAQQKLRQAQETGNADEINFFQLRIAELNNFKKTFSKELGERIVIR